MKAAALGVGLEPAAQARPLAKQRLVGDLDRALVDREQAGLGEHGERPGGVGVAVELELVERNAAADERLRLLLGAGEAQQHRPGPEPLGLAEALVGVLGKAGDRAADAAASLVDLVAQGAARRAAARARPGPRRAAAGRRALPATSPTSAETSRGSIRRPARRAGSSIARRSSSRRIGPTRTWLALTSVESSACSAQRP